MFNEDFVWGVATAAYQIEGGVREDGRTASIWDRHCQKENVIFNGDTGDVACDFYHRYKEDISIMKSLGIKAFRFSLSWNRILPNGIGKVNEHGVDFYNRVIDELLASGITPYITLLHWDLPLCLYEKGGYMNPEFPDWFAEYAKVVAGRFSDRVKYFMTFNEPQLIMGAHRGSGKAPGVKLTDAETVPMVHNILLAHGKAVLALRAYGANDLQVGWANQGRFFYPAIESQEAEEAAKRETFAYRYDNWYSSLSWYADPVYLGRYPEPMLSQLQKYLPNGWEEDMKIIAQPLDFCGQNFYDATPMDAEGNIIKDQQGAKYNSEGWRVTPAGIRYAVKWLHERYGLPIYITENGMCCHDWVSLDGKVHDPQRQDFLHRYLLELDRAINEGVPVKGYFCWSLLDNMEWELGYRPRFGLIYVDYQTQTRIVKDSALWYKQVIATNGKSLRVVTIKNDGE